MKRIAHLFVSSTILMFVILAAVTILGCSQIPGEGATLISVPEPAPHKTSVNFIVVNEKGNLFAYVPEGIARVNRVVFGASEPYVEVQKSISNGERYTRDGNRLVRVPRGSEFIDWGGLITLYVKDANELKGLILRQGRG